MFTVAISKAACHVGQHSVQDYVQHIHAHILQVWSHISQCALTCWTIVLNFTQIRFEITEPSKALLKSITATRTKRARQVVIWNKLLILKCSVLALYIHNHNGSMQLQCTSSSAIWNTASDNAIFILYSSLFTIMVKICRQIVIN